MSGLRRRMYSSWLPMHSAKMRLLMRRRGAKNTKSWDGGEGGGREKDREGKKEYREERKEMKGGEGRGRKEKMKFKFVSASYCSW